MEARDLRVCETHLKKQYSYPDRRERAVFDSTSAMLPPSLLSRYRLRQGLATIAQSTEKLSTYIGTSPPMLDLLQGLVVRNISIVWSVRKT